MKEMMPMPKKAMMNKKAVREMMKPKDIPCKFSKRGK